jgi:hypothetical protein
MVEQIVIFDIGEAGYKSWWFPCCGLLLALLFKGMSLLGSKIIFLSDEIIKSERVLPRREKTIRLLIYFSLVWTMFAFLLTYPKYRTLANRLQENNTSFIEGKIENFSSNKSAPRVEERFSISGVTFSYKRGSLELGYALVRMDGGIIENNMYARIWYVDNNILRLEVDKIKK